MRIKETIAKNYCLMMNVLLSIAIRDLQGNGGRVNVLILRFTTEHIGEGGVKIDLIKRTVVGGRGNLFLLNFPLSPPPPLLTLTVE